MAVVGGPDQPPPLQRFLNLVQHVHAGAGPARTIIVTDPYLLSGSSARGTPGGFSNFCRYLSTIKSGNDAKLFIPPTFKKPSANRRQWIRCLQSKFPGIAVGSFQSKFRFHDRLYMVEHDSCIRGIFGPSMNALKDADIALIGELELPGTLEKLAQWFDLRSPQRRPRK